MEKNDEAEKKRIIEDTEECEDCIYWDEDVEDCSIHEEPDDTGKCEYFV